MCVSGERVEWGRASRSLRLHADSCTHKLAEPPRAFVQMKRATPRVAGRGWRRGRRGGGEAAKAELARARLELERSVEIA